MNKQTNYSEILKNTVGHKTEIDKRDSSKFVMSTCDWNCSFSPMSMRVKLFPLSKMHVTVPIIQLSMCNICKHDVVCTAPPLNVN